MKRQKIKSQGKTYSLDEYDVETYGLATYLSDSEYSNGDFRRSLSMMPFEYIDKSAKDFKWDMYGGIDMEKNKKVSNAFIINFAKFREHGKGLYIYSGTRGSGKTLLACCLVNEVIDRQNVNAKFINIMDYLDLTKKGYASAADKEEKDSILKSTVLVLDDIGVELSKDWINTTLYQLINYRYSNKLITIITSNVAIESLKIDGRIKDRLNAMCIPVHMPEISIRDKLSTAANADFMKDVM